jgi:hypothetical protein
MQNTITFLNWKISVEKYYPHINSHIGYAFFPDNRQ